MRVFTPEIVDGTGFNLKAHSSKAAYRTRHVERRRDQDPSLAWVGLQEPERECGILGSVSGSGLDQHALRIYPG
jgi:hypothetical protein